jgi:hydroxymethylpyrimidine/phosphomethylpyrimidine kinase
MVTLVADTLAEHAPDIPLVVDPVMVAKGGASLLADDAVAHIRRVRLPLASLVTPNLPEAEILAGMAIPDEAAMRHAAEALLTLGVPAVLLKGGHLPGDDVVDLLATSSTVAASPSMPVLIASVPRSDSTQRICRRRKSGGTGCTPCTPSVFCAVSAVIAVIAKPASAVTALISAWMPAPPPESEPAMISTRPRITVGGMVVAGISARPAAPRRRRTGRGRPR